MTFSANECPSSGQPPADAPHAKAYTEQSAELVFMHNADGQFLMFFWPTAASLGIPSDRIVGQPLTGDFGPVEPGEYLHHIRAVLATQAPQQFVTRFRLGQQRLLLDLTMSPVLVPERAPANVMVIGRLCAVEVNLAEAAAWEESALPTGSQTGRNEPRPTISPERHHKLLTQVAWNIRRTLNLPTIWQQTVEGLGKVLNVNRCIVMPYTINAPCVRVTAEYCRGAHCPMKGLEFPIATDPDIRSAIATLKPVNVRNQHPQVLLPDPPGPRTLRSLMTHAMLVITTSYQDQPNGLIVLYQDDQPRRWTEVELEFVQDLADQVGTAIAHATLIANSQSLADELRRIADELQRTNHNLLEKQAELKDAKRQADEARQQAEEASRLKSEFLANTSHELRTPLNGMIGFLKLILDGMVDGPEEQLEFITEAHHSALHLLSVLNDILDIAKVEAGKLQIELSPVKLRELLDEVEHHSSSQIHQKGLSFEIQKPPTDDEIILYGDYQRLVQVMLNLVGNAIKFTHEGGVTVSVEVIKKRVTIRAKDQEKELPGFAKVRVADTGIGVSLDKQDKLFQSFSQVDGSRTRQYGGTGLGLAISQRLVEAMGGVVNFYSMGEGLGSTVTFTVPLYQEPVMITSQTADGLDLLLKGSPPLPDGVGSKDGAELGARDEAAIAPDLT